MILKATIKLATAFIGSRGIDEIEGIRKIARVNDIQPKLFTRRLRHLFYKYATEELKIDGYDYNAIKLDGVLNVDPNQMTGIHIRKFKNKETGLESTEKFEAYPVGTEFSFGLFIDTKFISKDQATKILALIGKYDGISQFGFNWGYGKYTLLSVEEDYGVEDTSNSMSGDFIAEQDLYSENSTLNFFDADKA